MDKSKMLILFREKYFKKDERIEDNTVILGSEIHENENFIRLKVTLDKRIVCCNYGCKFTDDGRVYLVTGGKFSLDFDYKKKRNIYTINGFEVQ